MNASGSQVQNTQDKKSSERSLLHTSDSLIPTNARIYTIILV